MPPLNPSGRIRFDELIKQVRSNQALLDSCKQHVFTPHETYGTTGLVKNYKCARCEGTLDAAHVIWYHRGLEHGAKAAKSETVSIPAMKGPT